MNRIYFNKDSIATIHINDDTLFINLKDGEQITILEEENKHFKRFVEKVIEMLRCYETCHQVLYYDYDTSVVDFL